jgi:hypothetical protein
MIRIGYKGRNKVNSMVREKFEKPEMEMVTFDAEDVIVTSSTCPCEGYCVLECTGKCEFVA